MPVRHDSAAAGAARGHHIIQRLGTEFRTARRMAGVSQGRVAAALNLSAAEVSRIERAAAPWLSVIDAARLASVVGLEIWVKAYPAGSPLRDAAHGRLLTSFEARLPPSVRTRREWPTPNAHGQALDLLLIGLPVRIGVEAETVLEDEQALERRLAHKRAAAGLQRMVLLVKDSVHNRRALQAATGLRTAFPAGTRRTLQALSRGEDPGADGLVVL